MSSEREKMLSGVLYDLLDPELVEARRRARLLSKRYNETSDEEQPLRATILAELLGVPQTNAWIEPPLFCDYGVNIKLGDKVYFNFNCVVLDVAEVRIGDRTMFGPLVQIYTATHPLEAAARSSGRELGKAINIGSDVWIGGGAIVCPGVTIGDRTVVGAGSVVTRDLPSDVFAAGNPCRVIRQIDNP
jgi:maltose O-acetyltransferase